jgi:hypothetical protein
MIAPVAILELLATVLDYLFEPTTNNEIIKIKWISICSKNKLYCEVDYGELKQPEFSCASPLWNT